MALKFSYFPLWAKGPACAVALELSGLAWEGSSPDPTKPEWKEMKQQTPWRELPVLEVPGAGMIGHELAILNFIGSKVPAMAGATEKDFWVSQQIMHEAEDVYQKLVRIQDTIYAKHKVPNEQMQAFWGNEPDFTPHNREFNVSTYLYLLEEFLSKHGCGDGKFTTTGTTVGECKLWSSLHALKLIKDDVLAKFPGLTAFYTRFCAEPAAAGILANGGKMEKPFHQYFVA
mmetsp:Transcript_83860/g.164204  ORF Transcript_83860/g.164204 Transcript_83860/m.164204 type:complete len:230 (+) Transcript_83860:77-766(+)|eukprot:CAMPEP_0170272076 /NCGR_PEP_ID=MMETSP0116_2-20130129/35990_1 /TAXON_ID=400756 /ORGANISM="Durinskia baltica, Strain CSIRO CS-38" /LENGTH=229 /DNA_ID=CAMNT_0010523283 /DNA_START=84 /DNA_END=773 /DNA_ORIENTATION=-